MSDGARRVGGKRYLGRRGSESAAQSTGDRFAALAGIEVDCAADQVRRNLYASAAGGHHHVATLAEGLKIGDSERFGLASGDEDSGSAKPRPHLARRHLPNKLDARIAASRGFDQRAKLAISDNRDTQLRIFFEYCEHRGKNSLEPFRWVQPSGKGDTVALFAAASLVRKKRIIEGIVYHRVHAEVENGSEVNGGVIRNRNQLREPTGDFERRRYSQRLRPALNIGPRKAMRYTDRAPGKRRGEDRSSAQNLEHPRVAQVTPASEDARRRNNLGGYAERGESFDERFGKARDAANFTTTGDENSGRIFAFHHHLPRVFTARTQNYELPRGRSSAGLSWLPTMARRAEKAAGESHTPARIARGCSPSFRLTRRKSRHIQ